MDRIELCEAAKMLGMSPNKLRVLMQRGLIDIGQAFPPDDEHQNWSYYCYLEKVKKFIGR